MEIVRLKLTPDAIEPGTVRWNEECDCAEYSPDGGATWVQADGFDTRHADTFRMPPRAGMDARCDAAVNAVAKVRQAVDNIVTLGTISGIASWMLDAWLIAIGPVGWLIELILLGVDALLTIGTIAINGAFTEDVYDELVCIFFANMDADGQVSAAQFADILTAIDGMDTVVNATMDVIFNAWGEVGLSNAGATGDEVGVCDCVPCWAHTVDFHLTNGAADGVTISGGNWIFGSGIQGVYLDVNSQRDVYGWWDFGAALDVREIALQYTKLDGAGGNDVNFLRQLNPTVNWNSVVISYDAQNFKGTGIWKQFVPVGATTGVGFDINQGTAGFDTLYILQMYVRYRAEEPYWPGDEPCE